MSDTKSERDATPSGDDTDRTVIKLSSDDEADPAIPDRTMIAEEGEAPSAPPPPDATIVSENREPSSDPVRLVEPGTLINNNYRIIELISAGGMGEVYRAENVFTGDPVAVKVILENLANDAAVLDMFRREARVLVQLRDDAIVRYHNFVLDGGLKRYCLIMEYVDGRHLGTRVKDGGPLSDQQALMLMRRLASGLGRAHKRGVTHRDLSPDNVILRDDRIEEAVLIDFGIARSTELGDGLAGRFAGKFKYIAPEQLGHWEGNVGPWTDVYGLALLIAMVARGEPIDMGDSVVSASAARQSIPSLDGISYRLFPVLQHMLEPDPSQRPQNMESVVRILNDPQQLASQYRLPKWTSTSAASLGAPASQTTGLSQGGSLNVTGNSQLADSHSPFSHILASPTNPIEVAVPKPARGKLGIVAGLLLAAAAAGLGWWYLNRAEPVVVEPPQEVSSDMAPRDTSTREGFLADQPLPVCSFATRPSRGPNAGQISVLGRGETDVAALVEAYEQKFGVRPGVVRHQVSEAQCAALDFLQEIAGRPAPAPLLDVGVVTNGDTFQLQGAVRKAANAKNNNLWLFLVSPTGGIYDLTSQLQPDEDGADHFGVSIQSETGQQTNDDLFMLVALTTQFPLVSVTAAPAGVAAAELLPRVVGELKANADIPAMEVVVFKD